MMMAVLVLAMILVTATLVMMRLPAAMVMADVGGCDDAVHGGSMTMVVAPVMLTNGDGDAGGDGGDADCGGCWM